MFADHAEQTERETRIANKKPFSASAQVAQNPGRESIEDIPRRHRRPHLVQITDFQRGHIVGLREAGCSFRRTAQRVGREVFAVHHWWCRWSNDGAHARQPVFGRQQHTDSRLDSRIRQTAIADRTATAAQGSWVRATPPPPSPAPGRSSVRLSHWELVSKLVLPELFNDHCCTPGCKQGPTPTICWTLSYDQGCRSPGFLSHLITLQPASDDVANGATEGMNGAELCLVMGADSSLAPVTVVCECGVDQKSGNNQRPTPGIMVWEAIDYNDSNPVVFVEGTLNSEHYIPSIIQPILLPFLKCQGDVIFQKDNVRAHKFRVTQRALDEHRQLLWPARSPDLSPVEHVWDMVERRLLRSAVAATNLHQLQQQVELACNTIPRDDVRHRGCVGWQAGRKGVQPSGNAEDWLESSGGLCAMKTRINVKRGNINFGSAVTHDDAAGRRVFSAITSIPRPCNPALPHTQLASPTSALKTSEEEEAEAELTVEAEMELIEELIVELISIAELIHIAELIEDLISQPINDLHEESFPHDEALRHWSHAVCARRYIERTCRDLPDFVYWASASVAGNASCCIDGYRSDSLLPSHQGELSSINGLANGFSKVAIVPDDVVGRRVFSGIYRFPILSFRRCASLTSITLIDF
ncbi:hypothetical protein PR048_013627 [Dryococelus australis]|uniref:Tc1-like transposase DDE domain-containing protein n=1 Tax=Dryococelus australis TaxID=614101 RepID=A0ABQ9HSQ8_9NEOP|nr:hypothetical protein PR048_013627 [Dryococelus australis]